VTDDAATTNPTDFPLEFTPEQLFFIAAATVWRGKIRDEALVTRVQSGVHAQPEVRATQPLRNTDELFDAFGIVERDPMYLAPAERIRIW
jgi:putative endopeptidase